MTTLSDWPELVMKRPWLWKVVAAWATLFPLVLLNAVVRKAATGEFWGVLEALSLLLLMAILVAGGLWFWRRSRRKIVLWRWGIELVARQGVKIRWNEVESIQAEFVDSIEIATADGRRIVVDRPMRPWKEFLELLPVLVEPEAREMAERAVQQVAMPQDGL